MQINKDIAAGLFFIAVGATGLVLGADYAFGTAAKMGAGFVPKLLAWILVGLGGLVVLTGAANGERMEPWAFGPLLVISAAVLVFAAMIEQVGFEGAIIAAILLATSGQGRQSTLQYALVGAAIVLLAIVLFPGVQRRIGQSAADAVLWLAVAVLLVHVVLYALATPPRLLLETAILALALAVLCTIVFSDLLGLPFRSLFVLDLWLPVKKSVFVPVFDALRGLVGSRSGG